MFSLSVAEPGTPYGVWGLREMTTKIKEKIMNMDILSIAAFAADQLINDVDEFEVIFLSTSFGPIVQIVA